MSHWNYRIVKQTTGSGKTSHVSYGLHEVYYNKDGDAWAMTDNPVKFGSDILSGEHEARSSIVASLELALNDAKKYPIFQPPEQWAPDDTTLNGTIQVIDKDNNMSDFYCPDCGGLVQKVYPWNLEEEDLEEGYLSCYKCCNKIDLTKLGLKEVKSNDS